MTGESQVPLFNDHWNTLFPRLSPLTVEVGDEAFENVPLPLTTVHNPVPGAVGLFPASVATTGEDVKQND